MRLPTWAALVWNHGKPPVCSVPRRNAAEPRACLFRKGPANRKNLATQAMGTGASGECGRESAARGGGVGNWKGTLKGSGRRLASSRAKSSIFLVAGRISGAFFSCCLASLIEWHIEQGWLPSKVFLAPTRTEPSNEV